MAANEDTALGTATGDARVIHPGDPDHPGEQVRTAGRDPSVSGQAVYSGRITIHDLTGDHASGPSVTGLQRVISKAVEEVYPGTTVGVDLTRTDR